MHHIIEEIHHDAGDEDEQIPAQIEVVAGDVEQQTEWQDALQEDTDTGFDAELTVHIMCLAGGLGAGVGQEHDDLSGQQFAVGITGKDYQCGCLWHHQRQTSIEHGEIEDQSDHAVGADMRVFHDGEDALTVVASTTKTVAEVSQTVFVQGSCEDYPCEDGEQYGDGPWEEHVAEVEYECHHATGEPPRERPVFHYRTVTFLRRFIPTPQGQSGEEDEGGVDTLPPSCLIDIYFHNCNILYFLSTTPTPPYHNEGLQPLPRPLLSRRGM